MIPGLIAKDAARSLREFIVTGFETDTAICKKVRAIWVLPK